MPVWLITLLPILWHNIKRFTGVILVAVLLVGGPMLIYRHGFSKGYSQCAKDRPTYGTVGSVYNTTSDNGYKIIGIRFNIWKLKLNLGI